MVEYTSFGEYSRSILEKGNFLRSLWKIHPWDQSWKTKVIFTLYLPFCWSWLGGGGGGDILEKDGATEKGAVEIEDKAPLHTYIGVSRKFYADLAYFHIVFWWPKKE